MGDRYYLQDDCPYCGVRNNDIYYAPTCGMLSHICDSCEKEFFVAADFTMVKKEDWTIDKEKEAFKMATNAFTDEEVDEMYRKPR